MVRASWSQKGWQYLAEGDGETVAENEEDVVVDAVVE